MPIMNILGYNLGYNAVVTLLAMYARAMPVLLCTNVFMEELLS